MGIDGVGVAWLVSQSAVALLLWWTQLMPALRGASSSGLGPSGVAIASQSEK